MTDNSDTASPSDADTERPLSIGLWEPASTPIESELEAGLPEADLSVVGRDVSPLEVHAVDCLVVDCSAATPEPATIYEEVRQRYPEKPLVVITTGGDTDFIKRVETAAHTAHVPRTETGIPTALVSARGKRVAARSFATGEIESDDTPETQRSMPQQLGLWVLWAIAVATYGIGDSLSTIIAVYFVDGLGEGNPLVAVLLAEFGIRGLFGLKIIVFLVAVGINLQSKKRGDWLGYYGPPGFVALLGAVLTASNLIAIATA
jgi:hypothetical protein